MNNLFRLPDFIIAGAQKCGTGTLHFALNKHPNIFMTTPKELNFFQDIQNYNRGIEWYSSFFKDFPADYIAGESSPEYFHYDHVAKLIANTLPTVKIIILLRNPVDRAYSGYWHAVRVAGEKLPFEHAIESESDRIANDPYSMKYHSYLYRGHYINQIEQYLKYFSRDRLLIIISEEYFSNPKLILTQVCDFLGIRCEQQFLDKARKVIVNEARLPRSKHLQRYYPYFKHRFPFCARLLNKIITKKGKYKPMPRVTRGQLLVHFEDSNLKLEKLIGRDLSIWSNNNE